MVLSFLVGDIQGVKGNNKEQGEIKKLDSSSPFTQTAMPQRGNVTPFFSEQMTITVTIRILREVASDGF